MRRTYGTMPTDMPEGFGFRVHFPNLANLNTTTGDNRRLEAVGGSARGIAPWTIKVMPATAYGHEGAIPCGALFEVVIDEENNLMSGDGFLLSDEWGTRAAYWVATGAQSKNSVDLADIRAQYVEDLANEEWWINFSKWALAATTLCATPAFADARAEIVASYGADPEGDIDEIMAAMSTMELPDVLVIDGEFAINVDVELPGPEITADGTSKPAFEAFYRPEADKPQKIIVDDSGHVYGHLALWESCHDGVEGKCLMVPRPMDAYASFNKPGVLTDRGMVHTGPIFAYGGHRLLGNKSREQAYGGIENAWADVRVVEGRFGPWLCGIVRPGVKDETVYAARASRISGHWKGGALKAIVSVNAEGYEVSGDPADEMAAAFAFAIEDGKVDELVASFPPCLDGNSPIKVAPLDGPPDMSIYDAVVVALGRLAEGGNAAAAQMLAASDLAAVSTEASEAQDEASEEAEAALLLSLLLDEDDDALV